MTRQKNTTQQNNKHENKRSGKDKTATVYILYIQYIECTLIVKMFNVSKRLVHI